MNRNRNIPLDDATKRELERALAPFSVGEFSLTQPVPLGLGREIIENIVREYFGPEGYRAIHAFMVPEGSTGRRTFYLVGIIDRHWYWLGEEAGDSIQDIATKARAAVRQLQSSNHGFVIRLLLRLFELLMPDLFIKSGLAKLNTRMGRLVKNPNMIPPVATMQRPTVRKI